MANEHTDTTVKPTEQATSGEQEKKTVIPTIPARKKKNRMVTPNGRAYITATFNSTLITITDAKGNTVCWETTGTAGFKGTKKSTPYAATKTAERAAQKAMAIGVREVDVYVKGPGIGRESAIRALRSAGLGLTSISDITPIPHNGCRQKNRRRV